MQKRADRRHDREHGERRHRRAALRIGPSVEEPVACPHDRCSKDAECDDADWTVCRSAVPSQVRDESAGNRRDDVCIGRVGRDDERGRRSATRAAEGRARQRERKQRMSNVIQRWQYIRMRKAVLIASALVVALLVPSDAHAWGTAAHRYIMRRAIELLPASIRPFFDAHRDELVMRVVDPDLWRTLGWDEDANHFLDFGVREYGDYPFAALPRDYDSAITKFGAATLKKNGLLPWRLEEEFGNLRRAMEGTGRGTGFAGGNTVLFSAVAAHY